MLKKHEAIMSDLEAYGTVIDGLRDQSKECKVGHAVYQQFDTKQVTK